MTVPHKNSHLLHKYQKIVRFVSVSILFVTLPVAIIISRNMQTLRQHAATTSAPLLFGTNLGLFPNTNDSFLTTPVQNAVTQMHVQLIRMPIRAGTPSQMELQAAQVIQKLGITPIIILSVNSATAISDATTTIKAMNQIFGSSLVYYELGNEAFDSNYTGKWNQIIPAIDSLPTNGKFIGPAAAENFGSETTAMANFYHTAIPKPFALSWHEYSCGSSDSAQYCLDHIDTTAGHNWGQHMNDTQAAVSALGDTMPPVFITEWNYDAVPPANDPRDSAAFQTQFVQRAFMQLAKEGVTASTHYVLNTNPAYNLVDNNGGLTAAGQEFQQMYQQLIGNGGGNTPTLTQIPTNTITPTDTPLPTSGITPTPTDTPVPTDTPTPNPCPTDTSTPTPTSSQTGIPTPTPTIGMTTGTLSVHFEGIDQSNNSSPKHPQRSITISFFKTNNFLNIPDAVINTTISNVANDQTGTFINPSIDLSSLPPGSYYILVKSFEGSLQEILNNAQPFTVVAGQNNNLNGSANAEVLMRMGDLNNDNTVDLKDYNILVDCYGSKASGTACKKHNVSDSLRGLFADINDDSIVNGIDYNILIRHFGENGYGNTPTNTSTTFISHGRSFQSVSCVTPTTPVQTPSASAAPTLTPNPTLSPSPGLSGIHVQGNKIVDTGGNMIQLRGVDRAGTIAGQ